MCRLEVQCLYSGGRKEQRSSSQLRDHHKLRRKYLRSTLKKYRRIINQQWLSIYQAERSRRSGSQQKPYRACLQVVSLNSRNISFMISMKNVVAMQERLHFQKFHKITSDLITPLDVLLDNFGFFQLDKEFNQSQKYQKGVCRTNCLDCLDRTNVVQFKVALSALESQMLQMGLKVKSLFGMTINTLADKNQDVPFIKALKSVWADMGDELSEQYAGSGSTISGVTRFGKEGLFGKIHHGMKSINRFFANNFDDHFKQEGIDLIIGRHPLNAPRGLRREVEKELMNFESEFQTRTVFRTLNVTWNVAGCSPADLTVDLYKMGVLDKEEVLNADVIIIALQEIVKLNASQVFSGKDPKRIQLWQHIIHINLNANQSKKLTEVKKFSKVETKSMVGCFLTVFVSSEFSQRISQIESSKVKQGFSGSAGNKGAVLIRFNIDDSSFCVVNAHLASGVKDNKTRLEQITDIFKQGFKRDVKYWDDLSILDHDIIYLMGDLNFRIEGIDNQVVRELTAKGELDILSKSDQLLLTQEKHPVLSLMKEGELKFPPTYKYDRFSDTYDSSKKQRVPSWCDRILYHRRSPLELLSYQAKKANFSDHRPVCASFQVTLIKQDKERKKEIRKSLFQSFRSEGKIFKILKKEEEEASLLRHLPSDQDLFLEHESTLQEAQALQRQNLDESPQKDRVKEVREFNPLPVPFSTQNDLMRLSQYSEASPQELIVASAMDVHGLVDQVNPKLFLNPDYEEQKLEMRQRIVEEEKVEGVVKEKETGESSKAFGNYGLTPVPVVVAPCEDEFEQIREG